MAIPVCAILLAMAARPALAVVDLPVMSEDVMIDERRVILATQVPATPHQALILLRQEHLGDEAQRIRNMIKAEYTGEFRQTQDSHPALLCTRQCLVHFHNFPPKPKGNTTGLDKGPSSFGRRICGDYSSLDERGLVPRSGKAVKPRFVRKKASKTTVRPEGHDLLAHYAYRSQPPRLRNSSFVPTLTCTCMQIGAEDEATIVRSKSKDPQPVEGGFVIIADTDSSFSPREQDLDTHDF